MGKRKTVARTSPKRNQRANLQDTAQQPWHPCDEFILPLMNAIKAAHTHQPEENKLTELFAVARGPLVSAGVSWLALNVSPDYASEFQKQISFDLDGVASFTEELVREDFYAKAMKRIVTEEDALLALQKYAAAEFQRGVEAAFAAAATAGDEAETVYARKIAVACDIKTRTLTGNDEERMGALHELLRAECERRCARKWRMICTTELRRLHSWLNQVRHMLRGRVSFEALNLKPHFVPTDLQNLLLDLLIGRKMTQLQLMTELNIGSKETFNGKNGKGGMKELIDRGLVAKDERKAGGYFRPDAPPESVL
jgi:hypothetical protein